MPLYEYACHRCGKTIEALQKFSDAPLTVHEDCGGELEKLISRSAFQLKGSGWYATDYPHSSKAGTESSSNGGSESKAESKSEKADGKAESKSESKKETKTESKSETKSESKSESKAESKPAPASADSK
jgi:putative FmdB family regulatory protein